MKVRLITTLLAVFGTVACALAQSPFGPTIDNSQASSVIPWPIRTGLPGVCSPGQRVSILTLSWGSNDYVCGNNNVWILMSSGGSSSLTLTTTGSSGPATYSGGTLNIPQYTGVTTQKFTFAYNGSTFAGTTGTSAQIAVYGLPALASLRGQRLSVTTAFAAPGLTAFNCSLGDASNNTLYSGGGALNLASTVTPTSAIWDGGFINSTLAANTVYLYCVATGANINTLTAGAGEILLDIVTEPTSSTTVQ